MAGRDDGGLGRRLRVLIVPSWYPSQANPVGGVFIRDQVEVLASVHKVAVLVPSVSSFRGLWDAAAREATQVENEEDILTIRSFAPARIPRSPRSSLKATERAAQLGLRELLKNWGRPDVIHAHVTLPAGWIAVRIGRRLGIPVVLTEHSSPFAINLRKRWMRTCVREALDGCDEVLAVGPRLAYEIRVFIPERSVRVVGNVIPPQLAHESGSIVRLPDQTEGRVSLAFVGGLRHQKGVDVLLHALARVATSGVNAHLSLAGDGPLRREFERMAEDLGLGDRTTFLGSLPRTEVYRLLSRSDLLVVPSHHESFCLSAAEALACGTPVVTTRCGGPENFVTNDSGRIVEPNNAIELAEAICELIPRLPAFDPSVLRDSVMRQFGPKSFLKVVGSLYTEVVGPPGRLATEAEEAPRAQCQPHPHGKGV